MEIIIDDTTVDVGIPEGDVTLGGVVQEVEDFLFSVGQIPTGLVLDGHELTQEELESKQEDILSGRESLKFTVITALDFVQQNLEGVGQANQELLKKLSVFADEIYKSEKTVAIEDMFSELAHFFDFWMKLEVLIPKFFEQVELEGKKLPDLFKQMRAVLEESRQAMEDQDFVLAADLIQYELIPSIELVDEGIPVLRELLQKADA